MTGEETAPTSTARFPRSSWNRFCQWTLSEWDLDVNQFRLDFVQPRVAALIGSWGALDLESVSEAVKDRPRARMELVETLSLGVSELFRNGDHWMHVREHLTRRAKAGPLRIWSAGCSFGAEPISVAAVLKSFCRGDHTIIATDMSEQALSRASKGFFYDDEMVEVSQWMRAKHFEKKNGGWQAHDDLRSMVRFQQMDLLTNEFESDFDLILCRNVLIYFSDSAKDRLYKGFHNALKPGGALFLGCSERMFHSALLGFRSKTPFFYERPSEDEHWRSAS